MELRYRALLVDLGDTTAERPVQIFGNDRAEIDRWAEQVLSKAVADNAAVMVYQTIETQVGLIPKPKKEAKP